MCLDLRVWWAVFARVYPRISLQHVIQFFQLCFLISWTTIMLYEWNLRPVCKILQTVHQTNLMFRGCPFGRLLKGLLTAWTFSGFSALYDLPGEFRFHPWNLWPWNLQPIAIGLFGLEQQRCDITWKGFENFFAWDHWFIVFDEWFNNKCLVHSIQSHNTNWQQKTAIRRHN